MRVIAGSAGGIVLKTGGTDLRPTTDRVREAIFSSLGDRVPGSRVLDLFAGTGSFGIEALSRGADSATFVERERKSVEAIRGNLSRAGLVADVIEADVFDFIRRTTVRAYDLIFADPPYAKAKGTQDLGLALLSDPAFANILAPAGMLCLEKYRRPALSEVEGWKVIRSRAYGESEVVFLENPAE